MRRSLSPHILYTDIDDYVCGWTKNLIGRGLIPRGDVLCKSIKEIEPEELTPYTQAHFFNGIAGWPYALKLAGWPVSRSVWTGSCPCQPFSVAGKQLGFSDDRDLWPAWFRLISICRPPIVFGEQVASAAEWLARVRGDMEGVGYALGCVPVEAASAGACQLRDRYWFVADLNLQQSSYQYVQRGGELGGSSGFEKGVGGVMAGRNHSLRRSGQPTRNIPLRPHPIRQEGDSYFAERGDSMLADELRPRLEERESLSQHTNPQLSPIERDRCLPLVFPPSLGWGERWTESEFRRRGFTAPVASLPDGTQLIGCPDSKFRRLPPSGVRWLGNGVPNRVAKLRALGNSIYPPLAAQFIRAFMEVTE